MMKIMMIKIKRNMGGGLVKVINCTENVINGIIVLQLIVECL